MNLVNLSAEPLGKLHSWIPHDLQAESIVFLPDACPGKSPLPTGTAVLTRANGRRRGDDSQGIGSGCPWRLVDLAIPYVGRCGARARYGSCRRDSQLDQPRHRTQDVAKRLQAIGREL